MSPSLYFRTDYTISGVKNQFSTDLKKLRCTKVIAPSKATLSGGEGHFDKGKRRIVLHFLRDVDQFQTETVECKERVLGRKQPPLHQEAISGRKQQSQGCLLPKENGTSFEIGKKTSQKMTKYFRS